MALSDSLIIELSSIDSTNNYAMQLIDADKAQHGLTVTSFRQTAGKGQRGKQWVDSWGQSLLMSIVVCPQCSLEQQFIFNASVTVAIADVLTNLYENWNIRIKWPNDIIINDKKAGGILIENIIRGSNWAYSIIGIGLNISQNSFSPDLPYATSLKIESGKTFELNNIRDGLKTGILAYLPPGMDADAIMHLYNERLYQKGNRQKFTDGTHEWEAIIKNATEDGTLQVQLADGSVSHYKYGMYNWVWE